MQNQIFLNYQRNSLIKQMNIHPISKALFSAQGLKKIWDCIIFTSSKRWFCSNNTKVSSKRG